MNKHLLIIHLLSIMFLYGCNNLPTHRPITEYDNWDTVDASFYLKDSIHHGEATYYGIAGEGGNCVLPSPSPWDSMAGAMNHVDYRNSEICGACVMVTGSLDSAIIRINDQCPECKEGDIDLTQNVFARIIPVSLGRAPITWHFVPCPVTGNIALYYTPSSSIYYTGLQVRNHRNPIRSIEIFLDSIGWTNIIRKPYNRFEATTLPQPPWVIRIRDVFGAEVIDSTVPLLDGKSYELLNQFPVP